MGIPRKITEGTLLVFVLICIFPAVTSLACYNCRATTDFDDSNCLYPTEGRTLTHECLGGEVCEKKLIRIDTYTEKVVRGCSSNCDGRTYIWTEDFRVHCCDDTTLCNDAHSLLPSVSTTVLLASLLIFCLHFWQRS